jgi:pimeloyl-ACP methyl ester carboxylesterase
MFTATSDFDLNEMNARENDSSNQAASDNPPLQPLLFVHGWWGGPWVWERFMEYFSKLGYRCHALNLNASDSTCMNKDAGKVSFQDHLDRLREKTRELGDPIVIGHSAGGLLIQKLLERCTLPAAVLVASAAPRGIFALRTWPTFSAVLRHARAIIQQQTFLPLKDEMCTLNLNRLSPQTQTFVYDKMVPASGKQAMEIALTGIPVDARTVKTPMLVVNGNEDRLTPAGVARAIAKKYGARYREYQGNGHYIMREPGWERVADDIHQWVQATVPISTTPCDPHTVNTRSKTMSPPVASEPQPKSRRH